MGRHGTLDDDYEDDPEEPDESDMDDDEGDDDPGVATEECPHCGEDVYEFAEKCPACGRYLSEEDAPRSGYPRWVVVTAVVMLVPMLYAVLRWWF